MKPFSARVWNSPSPKARWRRPRRDYARLQRGLTPEQAVQQNVAEVDGPSDAPKPKEPSKAKNGKSAGCSAKAMEAKPNDAAGEPTAPR